MKTIAIAALIVLATASAAYAERIVTLISEETVIRGSDEKPRVECERTYEIYETKNGTTETRVDRSSGAC